MEKMRIQKALSALGVCSRRKAEEYLLAGRITLNGEVVTQLGTLCTEGDVIALDGQVVMGKEREHVYLAFHKPYDVVSTLSDPQGRKTVADFIPKEYGRLYPVGRLDHNSTGLMILTDDGEFANLVNHPSSAPEKEYLVRVKNKMRGDEKEALANGLYVAVDGYTALPCEMEILKEYEDGALLSIILREGKKRQIRHMMETLDHPVRILTRIRIGNVLLGSLKEGEIQEIPTALIQEMKESCLKAKIENKFLDGEQDGKRGE